MLGHLQGVRITLALLCLQLKRFSFQGSARKDTQNLNGQSVNWRFVSGVTSTTSELEMQGTGLWL